MNACIATYRDRISDLKCVIVIPTYNNQGTIAQVISDVKQYTSNIIVVNDGSTDGTSNILAGIDNIQKIEYSDNKGKGYAIKSGLDEAYRLGYRYAITIDSDGQHYADDIPVFINRIEQVPDSLVIGARNLLADNMPSKNTFANKFSNFWYKVETGHTLTDTQSGYRLYPLQKLQGLHLITRRYEFEIEIIVRAAWRGINVENVPVKVYYAPKGERVSHFRPLRDFVRISILNTALVTCALLFYYPWKFARSFTITNIRHFIYNRIIHSNDSDIKIATSIGWGVFCGIIPIWGYQLLFSGISAHFLRLNTVIAMVFSNISIPPMIPFILYGSMVLGTFILNIDNVFNLDTISFETIGMSLWQYVVGSIALASIAASVSFGISLLLLSLKRRNL